MAFARRGRRPRVLAGRGDDLRGTGGRRTGRRAPPAGQVARRTQAQVGVGRAARRTARRDRRAAVASWPSWSSGTPAAPAASRPPSADPAVTEVAAGSGLLVPGLFDHYQSFEPRPAAFFGVPVVRRPGGGLVTVAGGGFVASGPVGKDRAPIPWAPPDLHLTGLEGAGEVQTPLTGTGARAAPGRRLGVVPAREVRRARRAHQPRAPAGRRRDRGDGAAPTGGSDWPGDRALPTPSWSSRSTRAADAGHGTAGLHRRPGRVREDDARRGSALGTRRRVHMDDLFEGWSGLARVDAAARGAAPAAGDRSRREATGATTGSPARSRRPWSSSRCRCWSSRGWAADRPASTTCRRCWCGSRRRTTCGWRRGIARDGDAFAPHWEQWAEDEATLFARERTRERADLVVDASR